MGFFFLFLILPLIIFAGIAYLVAGYARKKLIADGNKRVKALTFLVFFISFLLLAGAFFLLLIYHFPIERR